MQEVLIDPFFGTEKISDTESVSKKADILTAKVCSWVQDLMNALPKGLPLNEEELDLLYLYLAQQHRLNMEIDASQNVERSFTGRLKAIIPFIKDDPKIPTAAHQIVSARLEADINRVFESFCDSHNIDPESDQAINWKLELRYMAQIHHRLASTEDLEKIDTSPAKFELANEARGCAADVAEKRSAMLKP